MRIGYTSGVFDLFHVGHLNVLRRARLDCDFLFAAVTTDDVTEELLGSAPTVPYAERLQLVRAVRFVDAVVGKDTSDTRQMWHRLRFDVVYKGGDWKGDDRGVALEAELADLPVEVVYFPYTRHTSSERLRELLG